MALNLYLGRVAVDADTSVGSHDVATNLVTTSADVGRYCDVLGAGAGGSTLVAVITARTSGTITLGYAASTAVTDSTVVIWTPYDASIYSISGQISSLTNRPSIGFSADSSRNAVVPAVGQPVLLLDPALAGTPPSVSTAGDIFGGFISEAKLTSINKTHSSHECQCVSWESIASERTTGQPNDGIDPIDSKFSGMAAGAVFQWLADHILDSDISKVSVVTGPTIPEISFDYTDCSSAFDSICKAATDGTDTYIWRMDARRNLYFELQTTNAAPWSVSDSDAIGPVTVTWTLEKYANVAYVTPSNSTGATIDNTLVRVTQNNTAIDARAAVRGGTGRTEAVVTAGDINTSVDAQTLADSIASGSARIPNTVEYDTLRSGLVAGQLQAIVWTPLAVSASFLIDTVTLSTPNGIPTWRIHAVNGALIGDGYTALANLASGSSGFGGASGGGAGLPAVPGLTAVSAPAITYDSGKAALAFDLTFPSDLGTMTDVFVRIERPYAGAQQDTSVNVPSRPIIDDLGPFSLVIAGGVVTNTRQIITLPDPSSIETWAAWFTTANKVTRNQYTDVSAVLVTFSVSPDAGLIAGAEWAPNPANPISVTVDRELRKGAEQWWRPNVAWQNPSDDLRFPLVTAWDIGLLDPNIVADDTAHKIISLGSVAPSVQAFSGEFRRVPDAPVNYLLMVRPVIADGSENTYVVGVTAALPVTIGPQNVTAGAEYAALVTGLTAASSWTKDPTGARVFTIDVSWTVPVDPRFGGVILYLVGAGTPLPGQVATGVQSASPLTLTLAQKDGPTAPDTWQIGAISVDANNTANTYVAGVTPFASFAVQPYATGAPTLQASGFSVAATYTNSADDVDGKQFLILTPTFTPPDQATDPAWSYVDFWAKNPADSTWRLYGHPDKSGVPITTTVLPSVTGTWNFLLVDKDANDKDVAGNSTTDPTAPPAGSATFSLSIAPPALGASGVEYASAVTSPSGSVGSQVAQPDGTYRVLVSVSATLPSDTRFGGFKVRIKYTSGALNNTFVDLVDVPSPGTSANIIWKPPAGSITSEWYFVSYNKRGQLNTIQSGTPKVSLTVGSTSQLDFTAAKLASLNQNLLRLNPATGVLEPYNAEQAIYGVLQLGGGTANGVCNTSGTAVVGTSGSSFTSGMVGLPFFIAGIGYTVQSFTDATHITLSATAGTQTGANWSFGRSPQFKLFDRANTQIGFWGDDSFGTGFVGLFAGKDVRLGGSIGSPILEVDSAGAVTIKGAVVEFDFTDGSGSILTIGTTALPGIFGQQGLKIADPTPRTLGLTPTVMGLLGSSNDVLAALSSLTALGVLTLRSSLDANAGFNANGDPGNINIYNGKNTAGMGVPPIYAKVSLTGQTGSISATSLQVTPFLSGTPGVAPAGLYRISWYGRTTTASGSDTLTVTISYNDGVAARTRAFAFNLNTTAAGGTQQIVDVIRVDGVNNVQYSTTRSGATGSPQYALDIVMERLT